MRAVLDCSAEIKAALPETDSDKVILLLDEYRQGLHDLLSPDILPLEMLNALATAERKLRIPFGTVLGLWQTLIADIPALHPNIPLLPRAYEIAASARIAVYDCTYVALA